MSTKRIDFEEPPIVEVVAGVHFQAIEDFNVAHFGLFWEQLPDVYTFTETAAPQIDTPQSFEIKDLPIRCWFLSEGRRRLVQLQNGSLHFNWRRGDHDSPSAYPEFTTIYPQFAEHLATFRRFVANRSLGSVDIDACELTYVNFVPFSDLEIISAPSNIMVDHQRKEGDRYLPVPHDFNWQARYPVLNGESELAVRCVTARRSTGTKENLIRLELRVTGTPKSHERAGIDEWFTAAHDVIVNSFADLTEETVQRNVWRRK